MQKVLFIEAGDYILKGLERDLESAGASVFFASGIQNGLKVILEIQPQLVVIGVSSDTTIFDFLKSFKENIHDGIFVLLNAGDMTSVNHDTHVKAHVDLVLAYPLTSEALQTELLNLLQQDSYFHSGEFLDKSLATVLEGTRDFLILTDEHLKQVFYMNEGARKGLALLPGSSGGEINASCQVGPRWMKDLYPHDVYQSLLASIKEFLKDGRVWTGEAQVSGKNGEIIPVSQQVHLHGDSHGGFRFVSFVIRDITELKRTQHTLEQQEAFYRLITENTTDLISLFDSNGKNVYSSPSYEKLLGFAAWELEGEGIYDCIHHEDRDRVREIVSSTLRAGREVVLQYQMMKKCGAILHFEATIGGTRNSEGQFERLIFVSRDISSQMRQREERKLMELHHLHAQKMESIGQLAAGVAHEMNTPIQYFGDNLRFIRDSFADLVMVLRVFHSHYLHLESEGYDSNKTEALKTAWTDADADFLFDEIPKAIEQSLHGVDNLAHIVGAMKEFSHPGTEDKIPVDFNQMIENTLTIARNEWKYLANIQLDLAPSLPRVSCLPDEIRQMLLNLIINACHAIEEKRMDTEEKGVIHISTFLVDGDSLDVELRVSDSGSGIPEEVKNRIFEPFFTTKPVGKGTGQGLAIVHNVVIDKHSGQLHVESTVNKGTTFIILLPVNPPQNKALK
jgi:PAS domain S-box-containing protein